MSDLNESPYGDLNESPYDGKRMLHSSTEMPTR